MSNLKRLVPLEEQPGMPEAIARVVEQAEGKVCNVCGLAKMGHTPESSWLGYARHEWEGAEADADMLARARELTALAYSRRPTTT